MPSHRFQSIAASVGLVVARGWAAVRLPSTFFPGIDQSTDMICARFTPGISLTEATDKLNPMGEALSEELPKGSVEMIIANLGAPQNARSAIVSP